MTHSQTGASGAERWMNCPGSVAAIVELPEEERKSGRKQPAYLRVGQQAHQAAAYAFNTGRMVFVDPQWPDFRPRDVAAVQHYVDWVLVRKAQLEERYDHVELRIEILIGDPKGDFRGTVDAYLLCFQGNEAFYAEVFDYKHGRGVVVPAENNSQLKFYAHGVQRIHPSVELFCLVIIQPNAPGYKGPDEWAVSGEELEKWATNELFPAILKTKEKDAPLKAGPWCRFCPVNETCQTFQQAGGKASLPPLFISKEASPETISKWTKHLSEQP